jgi:hypothetical protein
MSGNVAAGRVSPTALLTRRCLPLSDEGEDVALAEQDPTAGRALTGDLPGREPSINRAHMHAAQVSDLAFRQKLLVIESIHLTRPFAIREPHAPVEHAWCESTCGACDARRVRAKRDV